MRRHASRPAQSSAPHDSTLSVVIPVFQEGAHLAKVIGQVRSHAEGGSMYIPTAISLRPQTPRIDLSIARHGSTLTTLTPDRCRIYCQGSMTIEPAGNRKSTNLGCLGPTRKMLAG